MFRWLVLFSTIALAACQPWVRLNPDPGNMELMQLGGGMMMNARPQPAMRTCNPNGVGGFTCF